MRRISFLLLLFVTNLLLLSCREQVADELEYIDATRPTTTPLLFAKDFISKDSIYEFGSIFNQEKDAFYFAIDSGGRAFIKYSQYDQGKWTAPRTILWDSDYGLNDPFLSNDEQRLYYISDRPRDDRDTIRDYDIWYSQKVEDGWSAPINAGPAINTDRDEYYISFSDDGGMYFSSNKDKSEEESYDFDIYKAEYKNGVFQRPQKLDEAINTSSYEADVFVAPDESYLIFCANRASGLGRGDLYISFKDLEGNWTKSINMGPSINSKGHELCPFVTKDGKYLFYTSNQDIYWVSTAIFADLKAVNNG